MTHSLRRVLAFAISSATVMAAGPVFTAIQASAEGNGAERQIGALGRINHLVVIYEENRSFDNLYGSFEDANGLADASATSKTQIDMTTGQSYTGCMPQTDPMLAGTCIANGPFDITQYIPADKKTRDLVHRFYQEQVQIDGGKMDKFVTVSDAKGLSMGYYPTAQLPMAKEAANYVLSDNFFHASFGGSFLNHQWLVCACSPVFAGAVRDGGSHDLHSVLGANGLPTKDAQLTTVSTGDYAVNTIQPIYQPYAAGTPDWKRLPALTNANIGDRLSAKNISWAWYSGGWNAANAGNPDPLFQYHHQAFNYYANYAPGTTARAQHLKDETDFIAAAKAGTLPAVSFVKPLGPDT